MLEIPPRAAGIRVRSRLLFAQPQRAAPLFAAVSMSSHFLTLSTMSNYAIVMKHLSLHQHL